LDVGDKKCLQNFSEMILERGQMEDRRQCEENVKLDHREVGCRNGRCMQLANVHVHWQAFVLMTLHLHVFLPQSYVFN
jgi:hypothetical protein